MRNLREYKNQDGEPVSLFWLVRNEPEWAENQIRHRDSLERERDELRAEVERLTEDRNCEKRMRQDAEETRERLAAEVERLNIVNVALDESKENDELRAELAKYTTDSGDDSLYNVRRLRAEVERLKADGKRLDWLKSRVEYSRRDDGMAWATLNWCIEVWSLAPATLDEAIDAVMKRDA